MFVRPLNGVRCLRRCSFKHLERFSGWNPFFIFFSRASPCMRPRLKKKESGQKWPFLTPSQRRGGGAKKNQKNIYRLRHRTPLRGRTNITIQTYGTEEVSPETLIKRIPFLYTLHKQVTHGHQRQAVVACCTSNRSFRKPAVVRQHTSR